MEFTFVNRKPPHFERCWKFQNEKGVSPCQLLTCTMDYSKGCWEFQNHSAPLSETVFLLNPDFHHFVYTELQALRNYLCEMWGAKEVNVPIFLNWLFANSESLGDAYNWHTYVTTERVMYHIEIDVDDDCEKIAVTIRVYGKQYVTENAMASRLTAACAKTAGRHIYPGWLSEMAFARDVCSDLLEQLRDAPAIQEQLYKTIQRLNMMLDIE